MLKNDHTAATAPYCTHTTYVRETYPTYGMVWYHTYDMLYVLGRGSGKLRVARSFVGGFPPYPPIKYFSIYHTPYYGRYTYPYTIPYTIVRGSSSFVINADSCIVKVQGFIYFTLTCRISPPHLTS